MKKVHYTDKYLIDPQNPITVSLIGCGGTGSTVLTGLARMDSALIRLGHPGLHVCVYDPDTVSDANIGRQLFSPTDIGQNKATVLTTRVNRAFGLDWSSRPVSFNADFNDPMNIMITCVDNGLTRRKIYDAIKSDGERLLQDGHHRSRSFNQTERIYYWLDFGNSQKTGQAIIGNFQPLKQPKSKDYEPVGKLPTVIDLFPDLPDYDNEEEQGPSCSLMEALSRQDLFINSTLANLGLSILWKMFREIKIVHHGVFVNLDTMKTTPLVIN